MASNICHVSNGETRVATRVARLIVAVTTDGQRLVSRRKKNIAAWEPSRRTEGTRTKQLQNQNSESAPSKTPANFIEIGQL